MMAMNGFTLGFFFPKQTQALHALNGAEKESQPDIKVAEEKPSRDDRYDFEPSTLALNAYRFF